MTELLIIGAIYGVVFALEILEARKTRDFTFLLLSKEGMFFWMSLFLQIVAYIIDRRVGVTVDSRNTIAVVLPAIIQLPATLFFLAYFFLRGMFVLFYYYLRYVKKDDNWHARVEEAKNKWRFERIQIRLLVLFIFVFVSLPFIIHIVLFFVN